MKHLKLAPKKDTNLNTKGVRPYDVYSDARVPLDRTPWGVRVEDGSVKRMADLWEEENDHKAEWVAYYAFGRQELGAEFADPATAFEKGDAFVDLYLRRLQEWFVPTVSSGLLMPPEDDPERPKPLDPRTFKDVVFTEAVVSIRYRTTEDKEPIEVTYNLDPSRGMKVAENKRVEAVRNLVGEVLEFRDVPGSHTISIKGVIREGP
jgi:hypothetical protein